MDEFVAGKAQVGDGSRAVPVSETIGANLADERTSKARFRRILVPVNFTLSGAWRFYDIRFILMDTASNKRLLEYTYRITVAVHSIPAICDDAAPIQPRPSPDVSQSRPQPHAIDSNLPSPPLSPQHAL